MKNEKDRKKELYTQVSIPDKEGMTILLKRAIGEMSNVEFADLCEISPVTIHRALHGKYTRPLPEHLLRTIADNSRDKEVTFEKLMLANGMSKDKNTTRPSIAFLERRKKARKTILNNLAQRNVIFRGVRRHPFMQLNGKTTFATDFTIEVLQDQEPYYWNFELITTASDIDEPRLAEYSAQSAFNKCAKLFLANEWNQFNRQKEKYSIVFLSKEVFDRFNEIVAGLPISGRFTTILLDIDHEKILAEHQIGDQCETYLFEKKVEDIWNDELEEFLP